ncbi:MAG: DUF1015 domain-containing protein [Desulfuromonas sp.]|jgi:hypothetical protein|nr:DUF1015 domain-containing protein [Desulfuromonas thiophila]MDD3801328.1 DUF1015 domain-containing protein [Desulfuromonas thiophila]
MKVFESIGLAVPQILLPAPQVDLRRWAVIACDQYTSDREYWQQLAQQVGEAPSTLQLIFPEVYLEDADAAERVAAIQQRMEAYLAEGLLQPQAPGFVLIERATPQVPVRHGLMVALDLECYDYSTGSTSLIRATEGTIVERLPPRIRVRRGAALELPHIMVLIDDPQHTVIEPLLRQKLPPLYDFELLGGAGHLRGYAVQRPALLQQVADALATLADPQGFRQRYPDHPEVLLYAMGDGNHSFATAKAIWQEIRSEIDDPALLARHPARYALVELVNLHDAGLEFEAIHRVLFDVDCDALCQHLQCYAAAQGMTCSLTPCADLASARQLAAQPLPGSHQLVANLAGRLYLLRFEGVHRTLPLATLQDFLDDFLQQQPWVGIDYIHGEDSVSRLASRPKRAGFYLPAISKHELFATIVRDGALPRKTFSMGHADEKRFYLEARALR